MADMINSYSLTSDNGASIYGKLQNLTYSANQYNNFMFKLFKDNGSSWVEVDSELYDGTDFGTDTWADHTFTNQEPNENYKVWGYANYNGTWHPNDPSFGDGFEPPSYVYAEIPEASLSIVSVTPTSITFSRSNTVGYLNTMVYESSTWVEISASSFPYYVDGNNIIVYNLPPNYNLYVQIRTYLKLNGGTTLSQKYSTAPSTSPYYATYTTDPLPVPSSAPSLNYRIAGGFNLDWGSSSYDYILRYKLDGSGSYYYNNYSSNTNQNFFSYAYGRQHDLSVASRYTAFDGNTYYGTFTSETQVYTAPKIPTITPVSDINAITLYFFYFSTNWTGVEIKYSEDLSYSNTVIMNYPDEIITINSLNSGTVYNFKVTTYFTFGGSDIYAVDNSGSIQYEYFSKTTTTSRPSNWSWTTTITQGGDIYSVSGKNLYIMPATEWNNFTTRINDFRTYKGLSSYSFTTVNSGTSFSASIFNEARTAISGMSPPTSVPSAVSSGDDISAARLNGLKDSLNSIV